MADQRYTIDKDMLLDEGVPIAQILPVVVGSSGGELMMKIASQLNIAERDEAFLDDQAEKIIHRNDP